MKSRARLLILNHVVQFSLQRMIGEHSYGGLHDMCFHGGGFGEDRAIPGDLVALQSAPVSKWYLGWLIETQHKENDYEHWSIESIEDEQVCDWTNVSLLYYDRSQVKAHPEWRWTDAQHEFNDRWRKVCYDERDAYIYLPVQAVFEDDAVVLGVRVRFGIDEERPTRAFDNWKKTTKAMMLEFYDAAVAQLKKPKAA